MRSIFIRKYDIMLQSINKCYGSLDIKTYKFELHLLNFKINKKKVYISKFGKRKHIIFKTYKIE